jgi:hypothetical protein
MELLDALGHDVEVRVNRFGRPTGATVRQQFARVGIVGRQD